MADETPKVVNDGETKTAPKTAPKGKAKAKDPSKVTKISATMRLVQS